MDLLSILTTLAAAAAVIGFVYTFLRNFKDDLQKKMERLEAHIEQRVETLEDRMERRIERLEERMFFMATGKKLEDAIKEERIKREKSNP